MKLAQEIIIRPVITEKSTMDAAEGKYAFKVDRSATKSQIRQAIEKLFNVKVLQVNTINLGGKKKRMGVHQGLTSAWKKAVVTIDTDPQPETFLVEGGKSSQTTKRYKSEIEEFGFGQ